MPQSFQILFLIDVNSLSCRNGLYPQQSLLAVRRSCLRLLCNYACKRRSSLRWGFKFFDSCGTLMQRMDSFPFRELTLPNFEEFENEVSQRFERHLAFSQAVAQAREQLGESTPLTTTTPAVVTNTALTQMLGDYHWDTPDVSSPDKEFLKKKREKTCATQNNEVCHCNVVFLIATCPYTDSDMSHFMGKQEVNFGGTKKAALKKILMPRPLVQKLREMSVTVFWLDTYPLASNGIETDLLSKQCGSCIMNEVLHCIGGKVIPISFLIGVSGLKRIRPSKGVTSADSVWEKYSFKDCCSKYHFPQMAELCSILPLSSVIDLISSKVSQDQIVPSKQPLGKTQLILKTGTEEKLICLLDIFTGLSTQLIGPEEGWTEQSINIDMEKKVGLETQKKCIDFGELQKANSFQVQWLAVRVRAAIENRTSSVIPTIGRVLMCMPATCHQSFQSLMIKLLEEDMALMVECETNLGLKHAAVIRPTTSYLATLCFLECPQFLTLLTDPSFGSRNEDGEDEASSCSQNSETIVDEVTWRNLNSVDRKMKSNKAEATSDPSMPHPRMKHFNPALWEEWFVPEIPADLPEDLASFSCDVSVSSTLLQNLQKCYRPKYPSLLQSGKKLCGSKAKSDQAFRPSRCSPRLRKTKSASLNISERSCKMVHHSYCTKARELHKGIDKIRICSSQRDQTLCKPEVKQMTSTSLEYHEHTDEANVVMQLRKEYEYALDEGSSLLKGAHTVINIALVYVQSWDTENPEANVHSFLQRHFLLTPAQINEKYGGATNTVTAHRKIREYKFQSLLLLETESAASLEGSAAVCIGKLTMMLRMLSFIAGPDELTKFLHETLVESYSFHLHKILEEVGDELNVPLHCKGRSSPLSTDNDTRCSSISSRSGSVCGQLSVLSYQSCSSNGSQKMQSLDSRCSKTRFPTMCDLNTKRQIVVPKLMTIAHKSEKNKMEASDPSKSATVVETSSKKTRVQATKKGQQNVKKVRRNLFDNNSAMPDSHPLQMSSQVPITSDLEDKMVSPNRHVTLKGRSVPETPLHKQGSSVLRRKACLRHNWDGKVTDVIEESPLKPSSQTESQKTRIRPFRNVKQPKFYMSGESSKSRNLKKAQARLVADRIRGNLASPRTILFAELLNSPSVTQVGGGISHVASNISSSNLELTAKQKILQSPDTPENSLLVNYQADITTPKSLGKKVKQRVLDFDNCDHPNSSLFSGRVEDLSEVNTNFGDSVHFSQTNQGILLDDTRRMESPSCVTMTELTIKSAESHGTTEREQPQEGSLVQHVAGPSMNSSELSSAQSFMENSNANCHDNSVKGYVCRFTRSKSKETGLSPESYTALSRASPSKLVPPPNIKESNLKRPPRFGNRRFCSKKNQREGLLDKRGEKQIGNQSTPVHKTCFPENSEVLLVSPDTTVTVAAKSHLTPHHKMPQSVGKNYTPPSALSLLHLTTSPVVMLELLDMDKINAGSSIQRKRKRK